MFNESTLSDCDKKRLEKLRQSIKDASKNRERSEDIGRIDLICISRPKYAAIIDVEFIDWKALGVDIAIGIRQGIGSWLVGAALDKLLGGTMMADLSAQALGDIATIVGAAIERAFVIHYTEEIQFVNDRLLLYRDQRDNPDTRDRALQALEDAESHAALLMSHIRPRGLELLGSFVMLADLHLTALLGFAEISSAAQSTFIRYRDDYKAYVKGLAEPERDRRSPWFDRSECRVQHHSRPEERWDWEFTWDASRERERGSSQDGEARARRQCETTLADFKRTRRDEPIQFILNPMIEIANTW